MLTRHHHASRHRQVRLKLLDSRRTGVLGMPGTLRDGEAADTHTHRLPDVLVRRMVFHGQPTYCASLVPQFTATMVPALLRRLAAAIMMRAGKIERGYGLRGRGEAIERHKYKIGGREQIPRRKCERTDGRRQSKAHCFSERIISKSKRGHVEEERYFLPSDFAGAKVKDYR